jgi:cytochrome c oxidase subunit 4
MRNAMADPAAPHAAAVERPQPKYMLVFAGLAILTAIELGVAFLGFSEIATILILLALAVWKAMLVALYYMHLRWEPRRLYLMVLAPLPLAVILVMVVLTEF